MEITEGEIPVYNFTFENQGTNTYLVYAVGAEDTIDSMSLGMLTNNKIPGLAPAIFTQMDTSKFIKYNVSSRISVKQFFSGPVNRKRILGIFNGIVDAMLSAEDYMIDVNSIIVDLNYIFADVSTCDTFLICLPVVNTETPPVDLSMFFKNIIFSTQFDQTENCDYVAKIMNYLNSTPIFSLSDFKELLRSIESAPRPVMPQQPPVQQQSAPQPVKHGKASKHAQQTPPQQNPQMQPQTPPQQMPHQQQQMPPMQNRNMQAPPQQNPQMRTPGMPTPNMQTPPAPQPGAAPVPPAKKITMMELLKHYNKENAELYKAQKAAEKNAKAGGAPVPPAAPMPNNGFPMPGQPPVQKPAQPPVQKAPGGFAIPGQPTPPPAPNKGFAVPGQAPVQPPVQKAPGGFAIPGQPTPPPAPQPKATPQKQQPPVPRPMPQQPAPQPPIQQPAPQPMMQQSAPQPAIQQPSFQAPASQPMNFGETTVLGGGGGFGETTVLGAAPTPSQPTPHLIRVKNNEKINIDKPMFKIGKERSYVDYCIADNPAISRSHANIISRGGQYFVTDTNSTNHTYVNGVMSQSNVETQLTHGDKVRFGNEEFEFKLY